MIHYLWGAVTSIIIGLMVMMFHGVAYSAEIHQGYFSVLMEDVQHEQRYREQVGTQMVDVYDYGPSYTIYEPNVVVKPVKIGEKEVAIYEWRVRKWTTTRPALGMDLRDYQIVGEYGGEKIIYVITSDSTKWSILNKHIDYLGVSIQEIVQKALKDLAYLPIAQRLLYSSWHTGTVDKDGNKTTKRSHMADWIADGKPKLLDTWWPKIQYAGISCLMPDEDEINELVK